MIVVTGGTGFLGSHLLYQLALQGSKIRAIKRASGNTGDVMRIFNYYSGETEKLFNTIEWVEGDVMDLVSLEDAFEGADMVYHLAAFVSFNSSEKKKIFENNIYGTRNVVNACLTKNVQKLCHVSSIAALGTSLDGLPINEEMIWSSSDTHSNYSISKFQSEMEVWRGIEEGLNAVIVNPSLIIGPGNWDKGVAAFFKLVYNGLKFYTPGTNGFVDVRDVICVMVKLMESNISGERFILNSENYSYKDIFKEIAKSLEKNEPSIEAKRWMVMLAHSLSSLKRFIFRKSSHINSEIISTGFKQSFYLNDKVRQKLNFNFISIEQSIRDTSKFFLQDLSK